MSVVSKNQTGTLADVLRGHQDAILEEWLKAMSSATRRTDLMKDSELRTQSSHVLKLIASASENAGSDLQAPAWKETKDVLADISRSRAQQGFTPSETAMYVFSLKKPLFERLRQEYSRDAEILATSLWTTTELLDGLGLYTTEVFITAKEREIRRQQEEMLELSTPVVKLWDGILALPLIGTLDSARTQVVMESPAGEHRAQPTPRSRLLTSPAYQPWIRWSPSTY